MGAENLPQPEFDPRTVQPLASHYTDWTIPAHIVAWTNPMLGLPDASDTLGSNLLTGQNLTLSWQLTTKRRIYIHIYLQHVQNRTVFFVVCFLLGNSPASSDVGELPRRKHTTFRTRRKFEMKRTVFTTIQWRVSNKTNSNSFLFWK